METDHHAPAIEATGLVKRYGATTALDGLDIAVNEASVLGLLGPNGAGKTTAVSILSTLLSPDEGSVTIAGIDAISSPHAARRHIGLSGQYAAVDEDLTGFENLDLFGRLHRLGRRTAADRARDLLERFSLTDAAHRPVKTYSGGMRRRLDLAGALVSSPRILFLDEPTTGLDPQSRAELWTIVQELVASGTTVLLTTQYMEEADRLADEIMVIGDGRSLAQGTPADLKARIGGERIEVSLEPTSDRSKALEVLAAHSIGEPSLVDGALISPIVGGASTLTRALRSLDAAGVAIRDVGLRTPTLDDVFLTLTGHQTEERVASMEAVA